MVLPEVFQGDGWLTYMYCYEVSPSDAHQTFPMPTQLPFSPRHLRGPAGDGSPASPNATPPPKMQERRDWTEYFPFGSDSRGQGRPRMRLSERIISGAWLRARLNRPPGCAKGALYEALCFPGCEAGEARRHPMLVDIKAAAPAPGLGNVPLGATPSGAPGRTGRPGHERVGAIYLALGVHERPICTAR